MAAIDSMLRSVGLDPEVYIDAGGTMERCYVCNDRSIVGQRRAKAGGHSAVAIIYHHANMPNPVAVLMPCRMGVDDVADALHRANRTHHVDRR